MPEDPPDPIALEERLAARVRPDDHVVMRQEWVDLLFCHWPVAPAAVQRLLPPGLTVDTFEGQAYVGLVPFRISGLRPGWPAHAPGLIGFLEVNVRTYVHRAGRDPGVWFFSLDAADPFAVLGARALWKLPYFFARMREERETGGVTAYRSHRWLPPPTPAGCRMRYGPDTALPSREAAPGSREFFLLERYRLYSYSRGRLYSGCIHHCPYPVQDARVLALEDTLVRTAGFDVPVADPPYVHYSPGVSVEIFPPRRL